MGILAKTGSHMQPATAGLYTLPGQKLLETAYGRGAYPNAVGKLGINCHFFEWNSHL